MSKIIIGVDLGGTKVRAAQINLEDGSLIGEQVRRSTFDDDHRGLIKRLAADGHPCNKRDLPAAAKKRLLDHSLSNLLACVEEIMTEEVEGIGIGSPGPLNPVTGVVCPRPGDLAIQMYGWDHIKLKEIIEQRFKVPCRINGDVRVMLLGERFFGSAKGLSTFMLIAPGTGFSCGVVVDGKLLDGKHHTAGEIWKTPVMRHDSVGPKDLNHYCSLSGLVEIFREERQISDTGQKESDLFPGGVSPESLATAAREKGHPAHMHATKVFEHYGETLARGIAGPLNTINAERLVVGGSGRHVLDLFLAALDHGLQRWVTYPIEVVSVELEGNAGIIGAAALFKED